MKKTSANLWHLAILSFIFSTVTGIALADWSAPPSAPPGGNTPPPINVGTATQVKNGNFFLGAGYTFSSTLGLFGQIGIGTAAPGQALDIDGQGGNVGGRILSGNINAYPFFQLGRTSSDMDQTVAVAAGQWSNIATAGDAIIRANTSDLILSARNAAGSIRFTTGAADSEKMTISNGGNVGIGVSAPGQKLEVSGYILQQNTNVLQAKNSAGTAETWMWPRWSDNIMYTNFGSAGWNIRNNSSVSRMFIQDGGNVGIGDTSPGQKLDVSGNIRSSGELISTNANQARFISGNYGVIHRNDGSNYYMLLTNSGDQYGSWNALRPFYINNSTGMVHMGNGLTVNKITLGGKWLLSDTGDDWIRIYNTAGTAYYGGLAANKLWSGGDISAGGNVSVAGDVTVQGSQIYMGTTGSTNYYGDNTNTAARQDGGFYVQNAAGTESRDLYARTVNATTLNASSIRVGSIVLADSSGYTWTITPISSGTLHTLSIKSDNLNKTWALMYNTDGPLANILELIGGDGYGIGGLKGVPWTP